jgi:SpoVK/Ycf46/Vps4 family AAA+-type ATPase
VYQDFQDYVAPKIGTTFIASTKRWYPLNTHNDWVLLSVDIPSPAFPERLRIWQSHLGLLGVDSDVQTVSDIASKFELTGFQIQAATKSAFRESLGDWLDGEEIPSLYLWEAARRHSNTRLEQVAQVILTRHRREDLVLPSQQKEALEEICSRFNNAHVVYDDWGFLSGSLRGRGLNILFAGPSGTGKTMAAEVIAGELGIDLYKIDLSTVVSKYIGETEKNLDVVFREAEGSNAILLFDEADSIFGKRSEVKDAHDRYANLEVSYLLQKMEDYKGIAMLTTNFRKNMDDAFLRRMHCSLEFPFPDEENRYEIWQRSMPSEAPTHFDLDLRFMAKQFKFTGGSIKNVAVGAAFYAAESSSEIRMEHVIKAAKREFQKQGRLITESDFGSYYPLVKARSTGTDDYDF